MQDKSSLSIAVIEPVGSHGGMDYYDSGLCQGLLDSGAKSVTLYTCDITEPKGSVSFSIKKTFSRIWGKDPAYLRGIRYVWGVCYSLFDAKVNKADLVHYHIFHVGFLELFSILLSRILFFKVFLTVHDVEPFHLTLTSNLMKRVAYRCVNGFIVHNQMSRDELLRNNDIPVGKLSIIPHGSYVGLVPSIMDKREAKISLGLNPEEKVLLFFGQIKEVKGLDVLLKAFSAVVKEHSNVKLLIAGKVWKDDFAKYQKLIDDAGLHESCICHIRYIHDHEIPLYYGAADLIVLPYKRIYQSGVLLMSMSYGIPTLVSDLPGMTSIVSDGINGFTFPSENDTALANKINIIINDSEKLKIVTDNAYEDMTNKYGWSNIGRRTLSFYEQFFKN